MHVTLHGFPSIDAALMDSVTREMILEYVHAPLFDMSPHKASGIDGLHASFYQKGWDSLKFDLLQFVSKAFEDGYLPKETTDLLVVLIPKVSHPERLAQFRPISICTFLYKLVTKMVVNRLKCILPNLIVSPQSCFVPGRQITDNIVIIQEVIHTMSRKRLGKGLVMIKLDLEKAYDRLN